MRLGKAFWLLMTALALAVAGYALANALLPDARGGFVRDMFANRPVRSLAHLLLGGIALGAGAVQFSRWLRVHHVRVHRWLGRIYAGTVAISGLSALLVAAATPGGATTTFGFGMLAVLWLFTTAMAVVAIRSGRIRSHQEWMVRSYALCLAAVTLRLYLPVGIAAVGFEAAYPAISWLCWVPNLVAAEWVVIPAIRGRTAPAVAA